MAAYDGISAMQQRMTSMIHIEVRCQKKRRLTVTVRDRKIVAVHRTMI